MSEGKVVSAGLMGMKFMRRKEEAEKRDRLRKDEEQRLKEARWVVTGLDDRVMVLADETRFDLSPPVGRRSFKNFNPVVEQLVEIQLKEHMQSAKRSEKREAAMKEQKQEEEKEKVVSDAEMAERLSKIHGKRKVV